MGTLFNRVQDLNEEYDEAIVQIKKQYPKLGQYDERTRAINQINELRDATLKELAKEYAKFSMELLFPKGGS